MKKRSEQKLLREMTRIYGKSQEEMQRALYLRCVTETEGGEAAALAQVLLEAQTECCVILGNAVARLGGNPIGMREKSRIGGLHLREDGTASVRSLTYWMQKIQKELADSEECCRRLAEQADAVWLTWNLLLVADLKKESAEQIQQIRMS